METLIVGTGVNGTIYDGHSRKLEWTMNKSVEALKLSMPVANKD